ncbi:MAG: ribonuclease R [Ignavibacteria bacterium]|nr:ribonuclease R [Ignavibacteria bacterium]
MKQKLIAFFKKHPGRAVKARDLAKRLDITSEHEYSSLKALLFSLYEEGFLLREGKRYTLNLFPAENLVTGKLEITRGGFGFVRPDNSRINDIYISGSNLGTAFNGDKVEVSILAVRRSRGKNLEGQITNIVQRKYNELIGTLDKMRSLYFVKPDIMEIHKDIYVLENNLKGAKKGDKVIVGNIVWESPALNPEGEIIEVLGKANTPEIELISIAKEFNLPYKFEDKTLSEAELISDLIPESELAKRIDYRDKTVMTIDPDDAKDYDDALSVERLENRNYSVGIHIADVSHYVTPNTNLDKEAKERGNSVYLVGKVIPMLPEQLSNNICSLVPNQDRLTYTVIIEITPRGKVVDHKIAKTIINSKRRFTYDEVQDIIDSGKGDFFKDVLQLHKFAVILRNKRMKEGSINFFSPEIKFELNDEGIPVRIYQKQIKPSNNLVEEFMLLANQIVSKEVGFPKTHGVIPPFVYRIHDRPDPEKMMDFVKFVKSLGYTIPSVDSLTNIQINALMDKVKGKPEETLINELAIRSMAKAIYSPDNIGHYGLGFSYYSHFTSPIRRYADLIVHRLLFHYTNHGKKKLYTYDLLKETSEHISFTERNAVEAERLSVKMKQISYLRNHIGDEFEGVISGVTYFGIFIKIIENLAEGLIHLRDLEGDFYVFDEKNYSLIGRKTKRTFRLGDKLNVKLVRVDYDRSQIDFTLID